MTTAVTGVRSDVCRDCGAVFEQPRRRGRPRELCHECSSPEANREKLAAQKRAYREARWHCSRCNEPLRGQTGDGLCGFCRQGIAA